MTVDCFDFYLWSTGRRKLSPRIVKEIFKEMEADEYEMSDE